MSLDDLQALLPDSVRTMAMIIGLPNTLRLVEHWGGTTFPVAQGRNRQGQARVAALAEIIGMPAAERLCKHFANEDLYIPMCKAAIIQVRNRAIVRDYAAGVGINELVFRNRLSDRQIRNILKVTDMTRPDPRQLGLFG
ncbi:Mor transcription activator family protein [Chitinivorax sp. PXF-14]|uniref:Mor transcription activator family protein n=1 Tax=Chitinivorax sp. PXF-14 TaxID=3230488 RepID=UPI00346682F8